MPSFKGVGSRIWSDNWKQWLAPFAGIVSHGLEIGSWEGKSALWFLDNILTNPASTLTCIDTFAGNAPHVERGYDCRYLEALYRSNLAGPLASGKAKVLVGRSQDQLRSFSGPFFDFIYIDGAHETPAVLTDMVLAWPLLKKGGVMINDDYAWHWAGHTPLEEPKIAIDAFLQCFAPEVKVIHKGFQVAVRKV